MASPVADPWSAELRRPFERMEAAVVRLHLARPEPEARPVVDALRYALSFAKLTTVRSRDGADVEVKGLLGPHARWVKDTLGPRLDKADSVWTASRELPEVLRRTRLARASLLEHLPLDRASLESEVTTRLLVVASGGGGGAGYVYPGAYEQLERRGLCPDLMVGTSIGSLMSMFRARRKRYDFAPLVAAARRLSWGGVFQMLETANRYGLPATLRLRLRTALGSLFLREDGQPMRFSDCEIPLVVVVTGITVDAMKHDLDFYEHLLDDDVRRSGVSAGVKGSLKALRILREFLARPDALRCIGLGREPGTEEFDVLDAAGFSSAVPAVIHYDVLRDDPRMHRVLDQLYAQYGITRLGEGGLTSNVPARIAWETAASGRLGRRNALVVALDCFAPNPRRIAWFPMQQAVRSANVEADRQFADVYLPYARTLSPLNLVPSIRDAMTAMRWGREEMEPHMPFVERMCEPVPVLSDAPG
ncbi:MAG: patatin-like phospholipase family protein [Myxococcota bacterium]